MSRWLDRADLLKARIQEVVDVCKLTVPDHERVEVIVDRQLSLSTLIATALGKACGACVVIFWTGGKNPDRSSDKLRMGASYQITVHGQPILNAALPGRVPIDDLTEKVAEALHGYTPAARPSRYPDRLEVVEVDRFPSPPNQLIYEISTEIVRLP